MGLFVVGSCVFIVDIFVVVVDACLAFFFGLGWWIVLRRLHEAG